MKRDPEMLNIRDFTRDYVKSTRYNDQLVQVVSILILSHIIRHLQTNDPAYSAGIFRPAMLKQAGKYIPPAPSTDSGHASRDWEPALFRLQNLVRKSFQRQDNETVWQNLASWLREHLTADAFLETEGSQQPRSIPAKNAPLMADRAWLEERVDRLFTIYARGLARTVVQSLDLYSLTPGQMQELLNFRPNPSTTGGSILSDLPLLIAPPGMFPSHPVVQSLTAALQAVGTKQWTVSDDGCCWHQYREGGKARIDVFWGPGHAMESRLLWEHACRRNDLVSDVLLAMLSHWIFQARTPEALIWLTVDSLLKFRGIRSKMKKDQAAGYRFQERDHISASIMFIQRLTIQIQGLTMYPVGGKPGPVNASGRILHIDNLWHRKSSVSPHQTGAVRYNPGDFGRYLLHEYRPQMAYIPRQVFCYDYYRHKWEKRLGRYLFFQWAIRKNHGNLNRPWRVHTIINNLQQYPDIRRPERTRKRLESALDRLQSDGLIGSWSYAGGDNQSLPSHNWLGAWLHWKVLIDPPDILWQVYPSINRQKG